MERILAATSIMLALVLDMTAHASSSESQQPSCSISGYQLVARKMPAITEDDAGFHILSSNDRIGLYTGSKVKQYPNILDAKEECDRDERCVMFTTDGWTLGIHDYSEETSKLQVIWPLNMHYCAGPCCGTYVSLEAAEAINAFNPSKQWNPAARDSSGTYGKPVTAAFIKFKSERGRPVRLQHCKLLQARPQEYPKCSPVCRVACCVPKVFSPYAMSKRGCDPSECEAAGSLYEYDQCTKECLDYCGFMEANAADAALSASTLQTLRMFYKRPKGSKPKYTSRPVQDGRGCTLCP